MYNKQIIMRSWKSSSLYWLLQVKVRQGHVEGNLNSFLYNITVPKQQVEGRRAGSSLHSKLLC